MRLSLSDNQTTRAVLAAVGLVQGFVYFLAYEFWPDDPSAAAFAVAPVFFVSVAVLIIDLSWTGSDVKRLAALTAVPTTVFTILAFWVWRQIPGSEAPYRFDDSRIPSLIFGAAMAIYVLLPFLQTYQKSGRREYPYDSLFRHSWNNLYIVGIALLLTGAFWSIIFLWYELFKLIDVTFFEDVFTSAPFVSISLTTVFGYGMALGRESERVTSTLRGFSLAVLRTLMPLLALIALLFLVSLPFTGLQPLWDTGHASAVLLSLIGFTILFLNGVYQDGTGEPPYDRPVRLGVEAALIGMPIYSAITFFALGLRIGQYGLTPPRFYGVVLTVGVALYSIGYATAVVRRSGAWMGLIRPVNMWMVWVIVATVIVVHTPLLDPFTLSANDQFRRLADEEIDASEFDYGFLRFQLGQAGWQKLNELEQLSDHPQAAMIRERVAAARAADSYRELRVRPTVLLSDDDITILEPTTSLPDSLLDLIASDLSRDQTNTCIENKDCVIFGAPLDRDPEYEYFLVLSGDSRFRILAYDRTADGDWERIGELQRAGPEDSLTARAAFLDSLRVLGTTPIDTPYQDLMVGEMRLQLRR
jgi:hypothetical protein